MREYTNKKNNVKELKFRYSRKLVNNCFEIMWKNNFLID